MIFSQAIQTWITKVQGMYLEVPVAAITENELGLGAAVGKPLIASLHRPPVFQ